MEDSSAKTKTWSIELLFIPAQEGEEEDEEEDI